MFTIFIVDCMLQPLGMSARVKYGKCTILLLQSSLYESALILYGCTNEEHVYFWNLKWLDYSKIHDMSTVHDIAAKHKR